MKSLKRKEFLEPIVLIKVLDNESLLIVDKNTTVKILDKKTLEVISGFSAKISHERYKTNVVSFDDNGDFFSVITADCRESRLYNSKTKKAICKVNRHQGEVSCVGVTPSGKYMFSGGEDGKTFVVDIKTGKLAFTLPPHADTINDIVFSSNSQWMATAGYDKKISVFNLVTMTPKDKLRAHSSPIVKMQFLDDRRLVSIDKDSKAIVWDIDTQKVITRLHGIHDNVTQITKSADDMFLFIGTELGYILIYELETYSLISGRYIKLDGAITSLCFDKDENHIIIGTQSNELIFYDIYRGVGYLSELLSKERYKEMEEYVKSNPLLSYTTPYKSLQLIWEKTLEKFKICLQANNKKLAMKYFNIFKDIPAKNNILQKALKDYGEFDKFSKLVNEKKLALAYSLANANPVYKESDKYQNLESYWKKVFLKAQNILLKSNNEDVAREMLLPFRGIPEKTMLIQELFAKSMMYKRFKIYYAEKKFKLLLALIDKNQFLKEFPEYDVLMNYADSLYIKASKLMNAGDTHKAIKILKVLVDFDMYKNEAQEYIELVDLKQKFFTAVKEKNIKIAYKLLDSTAELQETQEGIKLISEWEKDLDIADEYASIGDATSIKIKMDKYLEMPSKYMSIATIYSWCYRIQLETAITRKLERSIIEDGIKRYILYFGLQDQIISYFEIFKKYYKDTKLNLEVQKQGSMEKWKPSMIEDYIISY